VGRTHVLGREPATGRSIMVTVDDGVIVLIEPTNAAADLWIASGLVDLQVNGYFGLDLNGSDANAATVSRLARALLATGVTCFAPTVITSSEDEIVRRVENTAEACANDSVAAACIPFIHVEGPNISPRDGFRGAHPVEFVRAPSLSEFERWQAACGTSIGLVTLSPHFPGSEDYISALVQRGVHVSLGHTDASHEQIEAAVEPGARLSTHLGNGVAQQLDRHPNPIWTQLAEDRMTACFIADGHHLPAETLRAMVQAKDVDRCILVSDCVALAGMPPGHYDVAIGGRVELSVNGRLSMEGSSVLAGATVPLITCVGRAVPMTGLSLAAVLALATQNPGRFAGNRGRLLPGERADMFLFHWDEQESVATVNKVWLAGELMYQAP
jgi:N-acetylglucosamine-6-phosphate deacetylase